MRQQRICCGDFLTQKFLNPVDSVDLCVTSPPYGLEIGYIGRKTNDSGDYMAYARFSREWLLRLYCMMRPDGRLCLNVPLDKNKGGQQAVYADMVTWARQVGWKYHTTIIWNESNISRRTAWGSWKSASAPFITAPVEMILVLYKERWKKIRKGDSSITRDDFIAWTNGMWSFNGESAKRIGHPAPFPIELPRRCIELFSYIGDAVLDPFMGSGTTLLACKMTDRFGVGVEVSQEYCDLAAARLLEMEKKTA